jgi:hypothetical protein
MSRAVLLVAVLAALVFAVACTDPMPTFVFDAADAPGSDADSETDGSTGGAPGSDGGTGTGGDAPAGDGP